MDEDVGGIVGRGAAQLEKWASRLLPIRERQSEGSEDQVRIETHGTSLYRSVNWGFLCEDSRWKRQTRKSSSYRLESRCRFCGLALSMRARGGVSWIPPPTNNPITFCTPSSE